LVGDSLRTTRVCRGRSRRGRRGDERVLDAVEGEEAGDELAGAAIAVGGEDDVLAGAQEGEEGGSDRGHAAGEQGAVLGGLEGGGLGRLPSTGEDGIRAV